MAESGDDTGRPTDVAHKDAHWWRDQGGNGASRKHLCYVAVCLLFFSPQHQLHLSCPIPLLSASTNLILKNDFNLYSCAKEKENLSVVYVYVFVRAVKTQGPVNFLYRSNPSGLSSLQGPYHTTGGTVKPR